MDEKEKKFLKFIWKVDNFNYCWNKTDDFLRSPDFHLDIFEGSTWALKLYPRGRSSYQNYVSVYLERLSSSNGPLGITIDYEIALLRSNAATAYAKEMRDRCFRQGHSHGFDKLVAREVLTAERSTLLPEDTLTLQCRIFPKNTELETYKEIFAKTHTEIQRFRRQWKEIDYAEYSLIGFGDEGQLGFHLNIFSAVNNEPEVLSGKFCASEDLKVLHAKIGVLDLNNLIIKFLVNKYFDIDTSDIKESPFIFFPVITMSELLENRFLYLQNGRMNLDCEFTICNGLQHSEIEGVVYGTSLTFVPIEKTESSFQTDLPSKKFLYCSDNIPSSLKNDFQNLFYEGTLSDFIITVGDKNFHVHKAVLCARSPVFKAMLTSNMKENEKNMVDISDLEKDTVHRMLAFMYTDMAGNLDWDTSKKLYFAADKYSLIPLKRICSEVLKQNLCVTSVREVLALANRHADEYLKEKAIEFISDHEMEVMCSAEWKTFMTEEVHLAAETMHQIFLKKAGNSP